MEAWAMEDLMQEAYEKDNDGYDMTDALWDKYYEQLERFYYKNRQTEKDWEELSSWEVLQVERDYETEKEQQERFDNPELFYMTGGI